MPGNNACSERSEDLVERMYRLFLFALFIVGFVGAVASADKETSNLSNLVKDVKMVHEADLINSGRWNINQDDNSKTLDTIAEFLAKEEPAITTVAK